MAIACGQPLAPGMPLPVLRGEYLTGRKAVLPDDARGKVALLALGFTYDSRTAVEAFGKRFRAALEATGGVTFYEIPMIGGAGRLARWFIDSGMRKGTPKDLHGNVITVYGGTGPWKEAAGFKAPADAYLIVIDAAGVVRWMHHGPFEESTFAELVRRVNAELRTGD